jgi:predicted TIM-barrel fold metal-dependent hydrolase
MIDFHQHIGHAGRTVEHLIAHQDAHGVRQAVVLPIDGTATPPERWPSAEALDEATLYPQRIIPFFHIDPRRPGALERIRRAHRMGARGFGEHKIRLPVDAPESLAVYRLCAELGWPVLLHFEYGNYNFNVEAFEDVLRANPETVFIGHAQAWWANISADAPTRPDAPGYSAYPKGPVVPGGLTDRWLEEFPNLYGDLSAGSGYNGLSRDPEFTRGFLRRHQDKLLWATDCPCRDGRGDWGEGRVRACFAAQSLPLLRELASAEAFGRITWDNARRVLRLEGQPTAS